MKIKNNRKVTINITNSNKVQIGLIRIFGAANDLTDANLPAGIIISVSESSHLQLKAGLLTTPIRILGLKYNVTTNAQLENPLLRVNATSKSTNKRQWQRHNHNSKRTNNLKQINARNFELLISATTYIELTMEAFETVSFIFTIKKESKIKRFLARIRKS